mmetsp:Transcript_21487/g.69360  ORF Transcript_21487/g.69360 Transcript_21487/m.69360 type:complete len:228 (+) Transcript_21487:257-940(+)
MGERVLTKGSLTIRPGAIRRLGRGFRKRAAARPVQRTDDASSRGCGCQAGGGGAPVPRGGRQRPPHGIRSPPGARAPRRVSSTGRLDGSDCRGAVQRPGGCAGAAGCRCQAWQPHSRRRDGTSRGQAARVRGGEQAATRRGEGVLWRALRRGGQAGGRCLGRRTRARREEEARTDGRGSGRDRPCCAAACGAEVTRRATVSGRGGAGAGRGGGRAARHRVELAHPRC